MTIVGAGALLIQAVNLPHISLADETTTDASGVQPIPARQNLIAQAARDASTSVINIDETAVPTNDAIWNASITALESNTNDDGSAETDEAPKPAYYAAAPQEADKDALDPWKIPVRWAYDAVRLPQAWALLSSEPGKGITVGLEDSAVYFDHEDLPQPILCHQEELEGAEWLGQIDFLKHPIEFIANEKTEVHHGTVCAGLISATANNEKSKYGGTVGVAYGSSIAAVSYDWPDLLSTPEAANAPKDVPEDARKIGTAIAVLVHAGARVINCSNGLNEETRNKAHSGDAAALADIKTANNYLSSLLQGLLDEGFDFIIVKAAGNSNSNADASDFSVIDGGQDAAFDVLSGIEDPGIAERILVVGGAYPLAPGVCRMASYSAGGARVDIVAPAHYVYSTSPIIRGWQSNKQDEQGKLEDTVGDGYTLIAHGTSFSTPIVSGIAAMVWADSPSLSGDQVCEAIRSSATVRVSYDQEVREKITAYDATADYGFVDAEAALSIARSLVSPGNQGSDLPVGTFSYVAPAGGYRGSITISAAGEAVIEEMSSGTGEGTTSYYFIAPDPTVTTGSPDVIAYLLTPEKDSETWQLTDGGTQQTGSLPMAIDARGFSYDRTTDILTDASSLAQWTRVVE